MNSLNLTLKFDTIDWIGKIVEMMFEKIMRLKMEKRSQLKCLDYYVCEC